MSKSDEYKNKIQTYKEPELLSLWQHILDKNTPDWPPGKAFEYLIIRSFELNRAEVTYPFEIWEEGNQIEQIDGVIYFQHLSCLIECKDYDETRVDFTPLAKMRSQLMRRPAATIGCIFSTRGFTEPAIILASYIAPQTILLWEETEISYVLKNNCICQSLINKFKWYVERCMPDFNTSTLSM